MLVKNVKEFILPEYPRLINIILVINLRPFGTLEV